MERTRSATLIALVAVLVVACAYGIYGAFKPPFSDQEIKTSIVDTWEANALFTSFAVAAAGLIAAASVALAYRSGSSLVRRLGTLAVALSMSAGALFIYGHMALTERTAQLTGHVAGPLYGLF